MTKIPTIYAGTKKIWREWLRKNHKKEKKVCLIIFKKHTGKPSLNHKELMEEAICFGWIDTTIKRLDKNRFKRYFVKRTNNSKWSKNTLNYAKELIKKRKMCKEGLKRYEQGLKKLPHDHNLPKNPETPKELIRELKKFPKALINFNKFAPSYKKIYNYWVITAKRKETREKRIKEIVKRASNNNKPNDV
jgi:uncharacterized protein YdeI (YjbR/CyaY-like superfamily)